jgi:predicted amidophosphoribosyltransferase
MNNSEEKGHVKCKRCGAVRGLIDGLCDNCTLELYGCLFPWVNSREVCEVKHSDTMSITELE